ncbi:hypothetical protein ACJW30_02G060600 [Castanea mollissima]
MVPTENNTKKKTSIVIVLKEPGISYHWQIFVFIIMSNNKSMIAIIIDQLVYLLHFLFSFLGLGSHFQWDLAKIQINEVKFPNAPHLFIKVRRITSQKYTQSMVT